MPTTPEPTPQFIVCSVCGLPWEQHGPEPTLETCVRLLKAELAKRPVIHGQIWPNASSINPLPLTQITGTV